MREYELPVVFVVYVRARADGALPPSSRPDPPSGGNHSSADRFSINYELAESPASELRTRGDSMTIVGTRPRRDEGDEGELCNGSEVPRETAAATSPLFTLRRQGPFET